MLEKNNSYNNKNIIKLCIFFLLIVFFYRLLLPFFDEPDFLYRSEDYYLNIFSFTYYRDLFDFGRSYSCTKLSIPGNFFDFNMSVDPFYCNKKLPYIFFTFLVQIVLTSILVFFYFLISTLNFGKSLLVFFKKNVVYSSVELKIIILTLMFPTTIYYLGVYSNEQFFFIFSLLFFIVWRNILFSTILFFVLFFFDIGNALVVLLFYIYYLGSRYFIHYLNLKLYILLNFLFIFFLFFFNNFFLNIISIILLKFSIYSSYFQTMYEFINSPIFRSQLSDDNLFFLKPIVTYMSMMFMTPNYIKSYSVNIIFTSLFFISLLKYDYIKENKSEFLLNFFISIFFIIQLVLILPSHSWFKYYIFLLPYMFGVIYEKISYRNIIILLLISNILTLINLIFYRINFFI